MAWDPFGSATSYFSQDFQSHGLAAGDINNDGVIDTVTAGSRTGGISTVSVRLGEEVAGVSPLVDFSLRDMASSRQALPMLKNRLQLLTSQRGQIGASQARVETAINVLTVQSENLIAAQSRIRDADIAEESAALIRLSILQQAASSVLAQANQQPQLALQLLSYLQPGSKDYAKNALSWPKCTLRSLSLLR